MATTPQPEAPPTPEQAPPEVSPPPPDVDIPSPTPAPSDGRSDIQQVVEARRDAVERGEGGREPDIFTSAGLPSGGGTGGETRNQNQDAQ